MTDDDARHAAGADPFNWIGVHPLMDADIIARFPFDHAGRGETSLLMAFCPEGVDMAHLDTQPWYLRDAGKGTAAFGADGRALILARRRRLLSPRDTA
jgi:creatinine amidohydrolase